MLELSTTDEFAAWFAALVPSAAEEVAIALDIVEQIGPDTISPGSSEFLLWYEHPEMPPSLTLQAWGEFREAGMHILEGLSSPRFLKKLSELPPDVAARVFRAVDRIQHASALRRRVLLPALAEVATGRSSSHAVGDLYRSYQAVLTLAGLYLGGQPLQKTALRELTLGHAESRLRLIYGVHPGREAGLVILGERLDRSFYGDSVRRAERIWRQFLDGNIDTRERAVR